LYEDLKLFNVYKVRRWAAQKALPSVIGLITIGMKQTGKRSAGKPHAAFEVAGVGNVTMAAGLRSIAKAMELPPAPPVGAPALDLTDKRRVETRTVKLTRHPQTKEYATDRLNLNHHAAPRLYRLRGRLMRWSAAR
jgi:hypothetical protein